MRVSTLGNVNYVHHNKLHPPLRTWGRDAATAHTRVSTSAKQSSESLTRNIQIAIYLKNLSAQTLTTVPVLCFYTRKPYHIHV